MSDYRPVPLSALAVSVLVAVALAAPASAAAARFSCRASALQAVYAGSKLEPTVANAASTPCAVGICNNGAPGTTPVAAGMGSTAWVQLRETSSAEPRHRAAREPCQRRSAT